MSTEKEIKEQLANTTVAPDDISINGKSYELASTQMKLSDAKEDAALEYDIMTLANGKIFKYQNGYAVYKRKY